MPDKSDCTTMSSLLVDLIAEERENIPYKPFLNKITGSVLGSIMLQQLMYWWSKSDRRPFYKFFAPCEHAHYREGDSWEEELGFSRREVQTALKAIGVKVKQGESKQEALDGNMIVYWTDASRKTWYVVNEAEIAQRIANARNVNLLMHETCNTQVNTETCITYDTETTAETTYNSPRGAGRPDKEEKPAKVMTTTTVDRVREVGFDPAPHQIANWGKGWSNYIYVAEGESPPTADQQYAALNEIIAAAAGKRGNARFFMAVEDAVIRAQDKRKGNVRQFKPRNQQPENNGWQVDEDKFWANQEARKKRRRAEREARKEAHGG